MNKQLRLALTASSILAFGLSANAIAQSDGSQTASSQAIQRPVPASGNKHYPALGRMLPRKPISPANDGMQLQGQPVELGLHGTETQSAEFTEFDVPRAGAGPGQGTIPVAINLAGEITGYYIDVEGVYHGFLRYWTGDILEFDVRDAGAGQGQGTLPGEINLEGEIAGYYSDAKHVYHGFLRNREGTLTTFDVPGAGTNPYYGTIPAALNDEGAITGSYCDNSGCYGFLRTRDGEITTFDPLNSSSVTTVGLDDFWAATGFYSDANYLIHGFLRSWDGDILTFDPPSSQATLPADISPLGAITGFYTAPENNQDGFLNRGFLRNPDGSIVIFDAATYSPCCIFTYPQAINLAGAIAGYDTDGYNVYHGFVRTPNGSIATFDAPNAGAASQQGTVAFGINLEGAVTGAYIDANNANHGFVRISR